MFTECKRACGAMILDGKGPHTLGIENTWRHAFAWECFCGKGANSLLFGDKKIGLLHIVGQGERGNAACSHVSSIHPLFRRLAPASFPFSLLFAERALLCIPPCLLLLLIWLLFCVAAMATSYGEGFLDLDLITDHNVHRALARPVQPANSNSHSSAQQQQQEDEAVSEEPELHDEPPATTSCHPQQQGTATPAFIHLPIGIAQFVFQFWVRSLLRICSFVRSNSGGTMPQGVVVLQPRIAFIVDFFIVYCLFFSPLLKC